MNSEEKELAEIIVNKETNKYYEDISQLAIHANAIASPEVDCSFNEAFLKGFAFHADQYKLWIVECYSSTFIKGEYPVRWQFYFVDESFESIKNKLNALPSALNDEQTKELENKVKKLLPDTLSIKPNRYYKTFSVQLGEKDHNKAKVPFGTMVDSFRLDSYSFI